MKYGGKAASRECESPAAMPAIVTTSGLRDLERLARALPFLARTTYDGRNLGCGL